MSSRNVLWEICVHKTNFQPLSRSDYHCLQCTSTSKARKIPWKKKNLFVWECDKGVCFFEETQHSIRDGIGDVYCVKGIVHNKSVSRSIYGKRMMKKR